MATKIRASNLHTDVKTMVTTMVGENALDSAEANLLIDAKFTANSTDVLSEGSTNLYFTNARADARITASDTDALSEGSTNLYYTNARADARAQLKIDALVGSAPGTLDTLEELGDALGDDPNFATTVTNSIAAKLPLAGGAITGNVTFGDNNKAIFGAGSDLQIYHDGANSRILEDGTGFLAIGTNGGEISLRGDNFNDFMLKAEQNSAVTLYHNALPKLATTSTGIDVTGAVTSDGLTVDGDAVIQDATPTLEFKDTDNNLIASIAGASGSLLLKADTGSGTSGESMQFHTGGSEAMRIDSSGNLLVGKTNTGIGTAGIQAEATGQLNVTKSGDAAIRAIRLSSDGDIVKFYKDSTTVGNIGVRDGTSLYIESTASNRTGLDLSGAVLPRYGGSLSNGQTDLGAVSYRFKDLYLSGSIANPSGNLTLDASGEIILDPDQNGVVRINDAGSNFGAFFKNGTTFTLKSELADYDMVFSGNDNGSTINALTLDMSAAGAATFNSTVTASSYFLGNGNEISLATGSSGNIFLRPNGQSTSGQMQLASSGAATFSGDVTLAASKSLTITSGQLELGANYRIKWGGSNNYSIMSDNNYYVQINADGEDGLRVARTESTFNEGGIDRDFRVESDSNTHMLFVDGGTNQIGVGTNSPNATLGVSATDDTQPTLRLATSGANGTDASIRFQAKTSGGTARYADIVFDADRNTGAIKFFTDYAFAADDEVATFDDDGAVFNESGASGKDFRVESNNYDHAFFVDAGGDDIRMGGSNGSPWGQTSGLGTFQYKIAEHTAQISTDSSTGYANLYLNKFNIGADDDRLVAFYVNGGNVGTIRGSTSGVTYNTTSDRRLKDNIEPIADATDKLMEMKPVTHTWIADPELPQVHGFIAQEMQEVVPEAVSGEDGGEEMMSMDYGRITPVIVAALQDALNEIEKLKTRIDELENN